MAKLRQLPPLLKPAASSRLHRLPTAGGLHANFYQSPEWRAFRDGIVKERGRRCERCGVLPTGRIHCDHVVEIEDGGERLDPANIVVLCLGCHNKKTAKARAERLQR